MTRRVLALCALLLLPGCSPDRNGRDHGLAEADALFQQVRAQVERLDGLQELTDIDHRLEGLRFEQRLSYNRVLMADQPALQAQMLSEDLLSALDLPLRWLVMQGDAGPMVVYNPGSLLQRRYHLSEATVSAYDALMAQATEGLPRERLPLGTVHPHVGIHQLASEYGVDETLGRLQRTVEASEDLVWQGSMDLRAQAAEQGRTLPSAHLVFVASPRLATAAMTDGPTLGLDAYSIKILVYEDDEGTTWIATNAMSWQAKRRNLPPSAARGRARAATLGTLQQVVR